MKRTKLVNWQEDMKITPAHLEQTENYFIEELSESRSVFITRHNFGLLPLKDGEQKIGIKIEKKISGHAEVTLYNCNAITASGTHIAFNSGLNEAALTQTFLLEQEKKEENKKNEEEKINAWYVLLSIDPQTRIISGEIDPLEDPPRHPNSEPSYKLHIVASKQIDQSAFGGHFLTIGKIYRLGDGYGVDEKYIPPCRNMSSHQALIVYFNLYNNILGELYRSSLQIITKVKEKSSPNELALNIAAISEKMHDYLTTIQFSLRSLESDITPFAITEYISTLASYCFTSISCLPAGQREGLLNYFGEWSQCTPGAFQELLSTTMEIKYEHLQIRTVMTKLEQFLTIINRLWDQLTKLEYIGQYKDNLVVSERIADQPKTEERRSGLFFTE